MEEIDYLTFILNRYLDNKKYFQSDICKRFRKEKENHITFEEFFDRCNEIILRLKNEHEEQLYLYKSPDLIAIGSCKAELWEMRNEDDNTGKTERLIELIFSSEKSIRLKELDLNEKFFLFKFNKFTNIKRQEYLRMMDILEMEKGINEAKDIIENEIKNKSNNELLKIKPELKGKVKGQPIKTASLDLTLKDIIYPECFKELEVYLNNKKNIFKYQYKALFDELVVKKYTLPQYYDISIEQMKFIIINYFSENVSVNTLKGINESNKFKDLPKAKDKLIIE